MPLHLQRHKDTGVWYYLRRTPADLKEVVESKPREYFSLKTLDRKEAELLARQWDVKLDEMWRLQRKQLNAVVNQTDASKLTHRQIQSLADQWLEHLMTEDEVDFPRFSRQLIMSEITKRKLNERHQIYRRV